MSSKLSNLVVIQARDYYKCVEPTFPRARTGVFQKDGQGNLELKTMQNDDEYKANYYYRSTAFGDSGAPVSIKTYPNGKNDPNAGEERHTVVAVVSGGFSWLENREENNPRGKCDILVTKVSADFIAWIKTMNNQHISK